MLRKVFLISLVIIVSIGVIFALQQRDVAQPAESFVILVDRHELKFDERKNSRQLIFDAPYLYWITPSQGQIQRLNTTTNCAESFIDLQTDIATIATDDHYVYWIELQNASIQRKPKDGGVIETVVRNLPITDSLRLYVDDTNLYWAASFERTLSFAPKANTNASQVLDLPALPLAVLSLQDKLLIKTETNLISVDRSTQASTELHTFQRHRTAPFIFFSQAIIDQDKLYWTTVAPTYNYTVWQTDLRTNQTQQLLVTKQFSSTPTSLAQDEQFIYGASLFNGSITRIDKETLEPTVLIEQSSGLFDTVTDIAVDNRWIYWITQTSVYKTLKDPQAGSGSELLLGQCATTT